jgi:poly-gamma-glutamate synthesis protein (capsule biosynthesis protein)
VKHTRIVATICAVVGLAAPGSSAHATSPPFAGAIERINARQAKLQTWHRDCPVHWRQLRRLRLTYRDFNGDVRDGKLILHRRWAGRALGAFRTLYARGVRLKLVTTAGRFGGNDQRIMRANATTAYNCRYVAGTTRWSEHAYGRAIDINPRQNPYVDGSHVSPTAGKAYLDRSTWKLGMIRGGSLIDREFQRIGWRWGGRWSGSTKDYMHFSATGR